MFNTRLKDLRLSNNLTQLELAKILDMNERSYRSLESGKSKPKYETIIKIATYFKVSSDYLLGLPQELNNK